MLCIPGIRGQFMFRALRVFAPVFGAERVRLDQHGSAGRLSDSTERKPLKFGPFIRRDTAQGGLQGEERQPALVLAYVHALCSPGGSAARSIRASSILV